MSRILATSFAVLLALASVSTQAAERKQVMATASGYGPTEQEALGDALARAAAQVNGGSASISTGTKTVETQSSVRTNIGVEGDLKSSAKVQTTPDFTAAGQIARYEVISASRKGDRFETRVKAWVYQYQAPTTTGKLDRVAVLPVRAPAGSLDFYRERMSYGVLADELGRSLERALMASGHFQLLDRATLGVSVNELALMNSDLAGAGEKALLKNVRGADFLVSSTLFVTAAGKRNPATGQVQPPRMELDTRIIVPATSEVAFSSRVPVESKGFSTREEAIASATGKVVREFDVKFKGKSNIAADPAADDSPRDDAGVKLPFD